MKNQFCGALCVPAFFIFCSVPALAAPARSPKNEPEPAETHEPSVTWERRFIESNMYISRWFDSAAEGIDLFLAGKKLTTRLNDTSIRLENTSVYTEGRGVSNSSGMNVNLRLPNVEEYWQLKFTSYDESEERGVQQRGNLRQAPRVQNYGATVGLFKKLGDVRTAFQPRVELRDPLKIAHSITFESVADLKTYEVNPKLELFANPDKGVGFFHGFNIYFRLDKVYSLTLINEGEYKDKVHLYSTSNGFAIGQSVTPRSSLSYSWIFSSNNQPNYHLDGYSLAVSWGHLLYRKILDYQITPHLDFSRAEEFRGISGINFSVSLNF